jgi:hypothetical protein
MTRTMRFVPHRILRDWRRKTEEKWVNIRFACPLPCPHPTPALLETAYAFFLMANYELVIISSLTLLK